MNQRMSKIELYGRFWKKEPMEKPLAGFSVGW